MANPAPACSEGLRPEIEILFPESCHSILDVGCGLGSLGRQLLSRPLKPLVDRIDICQYIVVAHKP